VSASAASSCWRCTGAAGKRKRWPCSGRRKFSVEELGAEPGRELIALHQRMLAADQELLDDGGLVLTPPS
jgi:hypothetical protein